MRLENATPTQRRFYRGVSRTASSRTAEATAAAAAGEGGEEEKQQHNTVVCTHTTDAGWLADGATQNTLA